MGVVEAVLALVGLVTMIALGALWVIERNTEAPSDDVLSAVQRISSAAHETELQLLEEQERCEAAGLRKQLAR